MIILTTGQPGAGKTLYTLNYVKEWSERENRPVYYNGISDLALPWVELQSPEKWYECPKGSIIVIDECQRVFRPRKFDSHVPAHVAQLETHRHLGVDLVLITQHPMLADSNVRRLVGRHFHVVRTFGMKRATVHEWAEVKEQCDKSRGDSIRHDFSYPVESFSWYKSAEVHTHKARIPPRLLFFLVLPLLLGACVYGFWSWYQGRSSGERLKKDLVSMSQQASGAQGGQVAQGRIVKTAAQYVADYQPRIEGLPHTAPVYDEVAKPVEAPMPLACLQWGDECRCYSQQATRMEMKKALCVDIVSKGFFDQTRRTRQDQRDRLYRGPEGVKREAPEKVARLAE